MTINNIQKYRQSAQIDQQTINVPEKIAGRTIKKLNADLKKLEKEEKQLKANMQDRKKFMSGKSAYAADQKLEAIYEEKDLIRAEIRAMQGKIS